MMFTVWNVKMTLWVTSHWQTLLTSLAGGAPGTSSFDAEALQTRFFETPRPWAPKSMVHRCACPPVGQRPTSRLTSTCCPQSGGPWTRNAATRCSLRTSRTQPSCFLKSRLRSDSRKTSLF